MEIQAATTLLSAQSDARTQFLAAKFLKQNAQATGAVAGLIEAAQDNMDRMAAAAEGMGKLVDVSV